jgi:hypothetical protein
MADARYDTKRLLLLRKTTRVVADFLRGQVKDYLATLAPLLRPKAVLGDYAGVPARENVAGADKAFKELQSAYEAVAGSKLYRLPRELTSPVSIQSTAPELTPWDYAHPAKAGLESKTVTVTSPCQWVFTYAGFTPVRLRELLAARDRAGDELQQCVVHALMLHVVLSRQAGVTRLLEALRYPVRTVRREEFGELPLTCVSSVVCTLRPPDDVIIESTEVSGMNAFEELIDVDQVVALRDPLRERLIELVKSQGVDLLPPDASPPA